MRPAPLSFIGITLWLILAIAASLRPLMTIYWQIGGFLLLLIGSIDAWRIWRVPTLTIQRQLASSLPVGIWSEVILRLHNLTTIPYKLEIFDDFPTTCDIQGQPQVLTLPPSSVVETRYRLCPQQRGDSHFAGIHLLLHSPWRLWKHYRYLPLPTTTRIYPNFAAITKYTILAAENRLGQLGIRKLQRRGEGLEFHQLREYRAGDTLRQIDWNATSRYRKLISKEYQEERDQQLIFLIDCGRRMLAQDDALSHFDHTLNATLLLAYVALRQGDALGLMTFSGEHRWLAPRKGMNTINLVLNTLYDLQPSQHTSDYLTAAHQLMHYYTKRALIVILTNLRDEDNDELLPALKLLRSKHLVLLASLQERILHDVLERPIHRFEDALRHAATLHYLQLRRQAHDFLKEPGIIYLDAEPMQLPIQIVNRYLEIKQSGIL
jgi:uncharacterized protein (DUF58 family)